MSDHQTPRRQFDPAERTKHLTEGSVIGSLIKLSLPIVVMNLLMTAQQLVDTFFLGRLGQEAVAAVSVSFPIIFLGISVAGGIGIAGAAFVAQHAGAGKYAMVNRVSAQTFLLVFVISLALAGVGFATAGLLLRLMGVGGVIFEPALNFLYVSFIGLIFTFIHFTFQSVLRGLGEVRFPMYLVGVVVLVNILLDPLFIFGWGPVPAMGVVGAAWATLVAQAIAAVIGFGVLLNDRFGIRMRIEHFAPDLTFMKEAIAVAMPASFEQATRAIGIMVLTFLVTGFGTQTIAAYGIGTRIFGFVIIPALGLSLATAALVGQNIGARNVKRAADVSVLSGWIGFVTLTAAGLLIFLFAEPLVRAFVPAEPGLIEEGARFVRIMSWAFGFAGLQQALFGTFRGSGKTGTTLILAIMQLWAIELPVAYVLSRHTDLGAEGIWWSFPAANVAVALVTIAWFLQGGWKKKRLTHEEAFEEKVEEAILAEEGIQ